MNNNTNPETIKCRCCNQPMHTMFQPACSPSRQIATHPETGEKGYWLIECHNAACGMHMQTVTAHEYATLDLSIYGVKAAQS